MIVIIIFFCQLSLYPSPSPAVSDNENSDGNTRFLGLFSSAQELESIITIPSHKMTYQRRDLIEKLSWTEVETAMEGIKTNGKLGHSVATCASGNTIAIGGIEDYVRIYRRDGYGNYVLIGYIEENGYSVALSANGNVAIIGSNSKGKALICQYSGSGVSWDIIRYFDSDDASFGLAVDISNDATIIAIGAPDLTNSTYGYVQVYSAVDDDDLFSQMGSNIVGEGNLFGKSLSISGDGSMLAVGDPTGDGKVIVFENDQSGNWVQTSSQITYYSESTTIAKYGENIDLSDDGRTLAIVGVGYNNPGIVQVFRRDYFGKWIQVGSDLGMAYGNSGWLAEDSGWSVSLSADGYAVAIGLRKANVVAVYRYVGGTISGSFLWKLVGGIIDNQGVSYDSEFGSSVALSDDGNMIAIGDVAPDSWTGMARIFKLFVKEVCQVMF